MMAGSATSELKKNLEIHKSYWNYEAHWSFLLQHMPQKPLRCGYTEKYCEYHGPHIVQTSLRSKKTSWGTSVIIMILIITFIDFK